MLFIKEKFHLKYFPFFTGFNQHILGNVNIMLINITFMSKPSALQGFIHLFQTPSSTENVIINSMFISKFKYFY